MRAKHGLEIDENGLKWLDVYINCFKIQKRSGHVRISYAAAMGREIPVRCNLGIPLPNWQALLGRHQLGATWPTMLSLWICILDSYNFLFRVCKICSEMAYPALKRHGQSPLQEPEEGPPSDHERRRKVKKLIQYHSKGLTFFFF